MSSSFEGVEVTIIFVCKACFCFGCSILILTKCIVLEAINNILGKEDGHLECNKPSTDSYRGLEPLETKERCGLQLFGEWTFESFDH